MGRRHKLKAEGIRTCHHNQQLDTGVERSPNSSFQFHITTRIRGMSDTPAELASQCCSFELSYMAALETAANLPIVFGNH